MECYKSWGADTNMNWSETYTALQQKTVDGTGEPLRQSMQPVYRRYSHTVPCGTQIMTACSSASTEIYTCLTPEQQKVVDEAGQKAVDYERAINRAGDDDHGPLAE